MVALSFFFEVDEFFRKKIVFETFFLKMDLEVVLDIKEKSSKDYSGISVLRSGCTIIRRDFAENLGFFWTQNRFFLD